MNKEVFITHNDKRVLASKLEYHIKKLSKLYKEQLILKNNLEELLSDKIEISKYKRYKMNEDYV